MLFILAFSGARVFCQTDSFFLASGVKVYGDAKIDTLINRFFGSEDGEAKIQGYRIQIYSGSSHKDANKAKADFLKIYETPVPYLVYKQPNYKVRVGDFRNRIEAQKLYHQLINDGNFKGVLIVPEMINLPEL